MKTLLSPLLLAFGLPLVLSASASDIPNVNWERFLSAHDLTWKDTLPRSWQESAFIGNGNLGAVIYLDDQKLSLMVNRTDFYRRNSRYPMGRLVIHAPTASTGATMRLDLWNAEARGTFPWEGGEVHWRSFASENPSVIVLELAGETGKSLPEVSWETSAARPPWKTIMKAPYAEDELHPPAQVSSKPDGISIATQRYIDREGGSLVAVVKTLQDGSNRKRVFLAVEHGGSEEETSAAAVATANAAAGQPYASLISGHRGWWHAYYPLSFLSIPDRRLESFYWMQVYKMGSAMRENGPVLDLMGPWYKDTKWPAIWWNLNLQLTYHPQATANRLHLSESLFRNLDANKGNLINNVPRELRPNAAAAPRVTTPTMRAMRGPIDIINGKNDDKEAGNLPWVLYIYWEFYRYQMDDRILRERVFPLLALTIGHYTAYAKKDDNGVYHLPDTYTPELEVVPDANYDLGLFKWGLQALVDSCERLKIDDPRLPQWRDILANLPPFPKDDTGLTLGLGKPLAESHRHYQHLTPIYPLHLISPETPEGRALIERSIAHWDGKPEKFTGFSLTGAASLYALLGKGDLVLARLNQLLNNQNQELPWRVHPNTFYTETNRRNPVIETPFGVMTALQEMQLQSWGGKIRVFPAVPTVWKESVFRDLRADGAFLVSAARENGGCAWVSVESLAGEPLVLKIADWSGPLSAEGGRKFTVVESAPGEYKIDLKKGERVLLRPAGSTTHAVVRPVGRDPKTFHPFGVKKGKGLSKDQSWPEAPIP